MARSVPSNANPSMLSWARETAGYDVASVGAAEKIEADKIEAWERGEGTPSLAKLRQIAKRYRRPLMVFYLAEPPKGFSVVKDFRFLPADAERAFSPELANAIRVAQERQAWAAAYLEDSGFDPVKIVGSINVDADPETVGQSLRERLGVSLERQNNIQSESEAYSLWRRATERIGVFVFQSSKVSVQEMRGFALPHAYAPAVVINPNDFYRPRIFTLLHELAHILIGESAVSGAGERAFLVNPNRKAERFCNQVAAETLVPAADFRGRISRNWQQQDDQVIAAMARRYWVSRDVILLRLVELGLATQEYLETKRTPFVAKKKKKSSSIPQATLIVARAGELFTRTAVTAYRGGEIHGGELTSLLSMPLKHLPSVETALFSNRNAG